MSGPPIASTAPTAYFHHQTLDHVVSGLHPTHSSGLHSTAITMEAHMARFRVPPGTAPDTASSGPASKRPLAPSGSVSDPASASASASAAPSALDAPASRIAPPAKKDPTPAADRIIACERCRCYKKKCSKTPPACSACVAAGRPCSLASAVPTSLRGLRARLAWLEQFIERRALLGDKVIMSQVSTDTDLDAMADAALAAASPSETSPGRTVPAASPVLPKRVRDDAPDDSPSVSIGTSPAGTASAPSPHPAAKRIRTQTRTDAGDDVPAPQTSYIPASLQHTADPWMREALVLVDAYFRDVNRSYPFLDRRWVYEVLEQKGRDIMRCASPADAPDAGISAPDRGIDVMMVYLAMAIGRTTLQRTGKLPPDDVASSTASTPSAMGTASTVSTASSLASTAKTAPAAPTSAPEPTPVPSAGPAIRMNMSWRPVSYEAVLALCLGEEETTDIVQLLLLLALYSLYNSCAPSTRPIVDMLARLAIRLGLTQRHLADESLPPAITERNRRIVWCIYVLDGMVCLATGMPAVLDDATIDLPLPSITVDEFASPERPEHTTTLQAIRQLVDMAKLQHAVLRAVRARQAWTNTGPGSAPVPVIRPPSSSSHSFSPPTSSALPQPTSHSSHSPAPASDFSSASLASPHALRTAIEDWYSNGCLLRSHAEADDLRIHVTIPWLAARYYNILMLLYFPTSPAHPSPAAPLSAAYAQRANNWPGGGGGGGGGGGYGRNGRRRGRDGRNAKAPPSLSPSLLSLAQKHVQANAIRFQQRQIPLNHLTLCCIFPVLFIFFHHISCHRPGDAPLEFGPELDICADMMSGYPTQWPQAHRGAAIARQLGVLVAAASSPARAWPPTPSDRAWLRTVRHSLDELAQQVLGRGSAYRMIQEDDEYDDDDYYYEDEDVVRPPGQPGQPSSQLSGSLRPPPASADGRSQPGSSGRVPTIASATSAASSTPPTPYTDDPARAFNFSSGSLGFTPDQASPASGEDALMGFL